MTAVVAALVGITALLSACTAAPEEPVATPRPVTTEEAQTLALARFRSFDAGSRPFSTTVRERGADLHLQGWVDYSTHIGYASVTGDFDPEALLWTGSTMGITPAEPDAAGDPPLPIPDLDDENWISQPIDNTVSRLGALLSVIGGLASDRPDNPLLLQQAGALWVRADTVDGTPVTVFASPPSDEPLTASSPPLDADSSGLRLWVTDDGLILRAEVRIGDSWSVINFPD
ncbi:MAG: hypothetical protein M3Y46_07880, partial [Actinomycetota bacterium]|nr:hypothetical protein [Actinomycetota bacterium]